MALPSLHHLLPLPAFLMACVKTVISLRQTKAVISATSFERIMLSMLLTWMGAGWVELCCCCGGHQWGLGILKEGSLFSFISSFNLQILPRSRSTDSYPETHFGLNTEEVVRGQSCNLSNSEKLKKK